MFLMPGVSLETTELKAKLVGGGFCDCDGINIHTTTSAVEADGTINERENGVVASKTDIAARKIFGATLTDNDVSGDNALGTEFLHAKTLADAVTSVLDASLSFFMGHCSRVLGDW